MTTDDIYNDLVDLRRKVVALSFSNDERTLVRLMLRLIRQSMEQIDYRKAINISIER